MSVDSIFAAKQIADQRVNDRDHYCNIDIRHNLCFITQLLEQEELKLEHVLSERDEALSEVRKTIKYLHAGPCPSILELATFLSICKINAEGYIFITWNVYGHIVAQVVELKLRVKTSDEKYAKRSATLEVKLIKAINENIALKKK